MSTAKIPIALQLYSVREDCAADLLGTIAKVGAMGYDGVEFAGFHNHDAKTIRKALDEAGLRAAGSHAGIATLADEAIDATSDFHAELGCEFLIVPGIPESMRNSAVACAAASETFTKISEKLRGNGQVAGFHAHDGDMKPLEGGESAWYRIARSTPDDFVMQYDTANGMAGGADPIQPILDFPGRGVTVHLKEWDGAHGVLLGDGQVPWAKVFAACESAAGTRWYIVEHESELEVPPIEAVDICLKNLRAMGK